MRQGRRVNACAVYVKAIAKQPRTDKIRPYCRVWYHNRRKGNRRVRRTVMEAQIAALAELRSHSMIFISPKACISGSFNSHQAAM
jgi:hypothetical protein